LSGWEIARQQRGDIRAQTHNGYLLAYSRQRSQHHTETAQIDKTLKPMVFKKVVGLFMVAVMMATAGFAYANYNAMRAKKALLTDQEWRYEPVTTTPSDPQNYRKVEGSSMNCQESDDICVVLAPESGGQPQFSPELQDALDSDLNHASILLGPYTGS